MQRMTLRATRTNLGSTRSSDLKTETVQSQLRKDTYTVGSVAVALNSQEVRRDRRFIL